MKPIFMFWSKKEFPAEYINTPKWKNFEGKYLCEGDSNVHLMNVKEAIHPDCFNIATGGDTPEGVLVQLENEIAPKFKSGEIYFEKAYIQIGANMFGSVPLDVINIDPSPFIMLMDKIIQGYKELIPAKNIVIASLPSVAPWVTIADWPSAANYPKYIKRLLRKRSANDFFILCNEALRLLCVQRGVKYIDIFWRLKLRWYAKFKDYKIIGFQRRWWDCVHYDSVIHKMIGSRVRMAWGIK